MDSRALILKNALPLVPFDGWSDHTLAQAAKRAGINAQQLRLAFPAGGADLIEYFFLTEDEAIAAEHPQSALAGLRVPDRIETLILARLHRFALHKEAVRRAIAHRALPWNAFHGCQSLFRSVDVMWRLAGDASTDFSYYTKRATLAALYNGTLLYWLNDSSEHMENTKEFLKRGLAGIAAFGKAKGKFKSKFKAA